MAIYLQPTVITTASELKAAFAAQKEAKTRPPEFWDGLLNILQTRYPEAKARPTKLETKHLMLDPAAWECEFTDTTIKEVVYNDYRNLRGKLHDYCVEADLYFSNGIYGDNAPADDAPAEWWLSRLANKNVAGITGLLAEIIEIHAPVIYADSKRGVVYHLTY